MTIVFAGGGTGGHLFPGIALAEEIRRRHPTARLVFVGTARGIEARAVPKVGFELRLISVRGLRHKPPREVATGLLRLPWSLLQSLGHLQALKPQVVVGLGGYAAGPFMLAAALLGVRGIVMEQNASAGVTTRLLARLAVRVIAAMPCPELPAHKTQILGNPVRHDLLAVRQLPYRPQRPWKILVLGGSQGARVLNQAMLQVASSLASAGCDVKITHQTGPREIQAVRLGYKAAAVQADVAAFIDDMADAYSRHDLVVCRAGATTLAELTACGRPALLVPFAAAAGDHQAHNAAVLTAAGAATVLTEAELTPARLLTQLRALLDEATLVRMAAAARALGRPSAVADIADVVLREVARV